VVEGDAFQAQKRYGYKHLSTTLNSHVHSTSYPIVASGHPLVIRPCLNPEEISVNGHRDWWLKHRFPS
jgi:hypothetical protein